MLNNIYISLPNLAMLNNSLSIPYIFFFINKQHTEYVTDLVKG